MKLSDKLLVGAFIASVTGFVYSYSEYRYYSGKKEGLEFDKEVIKSQDKLIRHLLVKLKKQQEEA